jgi:hypothetical protein
MTLAPVQNMCIAKYIINLFVFLNHFMNEKCNLFYKILMRA